MTRTIAIALGAGLMVVSLSGHAAGDAAAGAGKAQTCAACHGPDGNSTNPLWPKLAGQHEAYMVKQLKDFKSGGRKDPVMAPMAIPLSDQDMEDVSAYYAAQKQK